jgi:hypothetical protein
MGNGSVAASSNDNSNTFCIRIRLELASSRCTLRNGIRQPSQSLSLQGTALRLWHCRTPVRHANSQIHARASLLPGTSDRVAALGRLTETERVVQVRGCELARPQVTLGRRGTRASPYLSGMKRDDDEAPIPGLPCLTGLYVKLNSPR